MRRKLTGPSRTITLGGLAMSVVAAVTALTAGGATAATHGSGPPATTTPIKHVVVIIGENHTFDNVFATYQPPKGFNTSGTCCPRASSPGTATRVRTTARRCS